MTKRFKYLMLFLAVYCVAVYGAYVFLSKYHPSENQAPVVATEP